MAQNRFAQHPLREFPMPPIACPACGAALSLPEHAQETSIRCPRCQKVLRLNRQSRTAFQKSASISTSAPEMAAPLVEPLSETAKVAKSKAPLIIVFGACLVLALLASLGVGVLVGIAIKPNPPIDTAVDKDSSKDKAEIARLRQQLRDLEGERERLLAAANSLQARLNGTVGKGDDKNPPAITDSSQVGQGPRNGEPPLQPPKEKPIPTFTIDELQQELSKSQADFFERYGNKRIEIEGVFSSKARDDGVTEYDYFYFTTSNKPHMIMVLFENPFVPGSLKPGQRIRFSGIVVAQYTRGVLAGYALRGCKLIKTETASSDTAQPVSPGTAPKGQRPETAEEAAARQKQETQRQIELEKKKREEAKAQSALRAALQVAGRGFDKEARKRYQEIIDKYPDTEAAAKAKKLLDKP
jgi:TolA-binding protein